MFSWIVLLLPLPALAALDKGHGVHPSLLHKYSPTPGGQDPTWRCLDGSKQIPWHAVNDDYCDCPDGSDEPGTSACPGTAFHCTNEGHIGATIPSSRVNDGLCEPECCDGSDEPYGYCPNKCKEVGQEYRRKTEAENKIRKTGSKIRSTYINFAQKEKKRLEALVISSSQEVAAREQEVARLKDVLDRSESLSAAALAHKKESPLYKSIISHSQALKSLQREHAKLKEKEKTLSEILSSLRTGYNPNYQDMAVLEAVRGWEHYAGISNKEDEQELGSDGDEADSSSEDTVYEWEKDMWSAEKLENELDSLLNTDYVNLLLEHENHIGSTTTDASPLLDLPSYIPDFLAPQYEAIRSTLVSWLETLGIASQPPPAAGQTSQARTAYQDAEHSLSLTKKEKQEAEEGLVNLFDPEYYGKEGEWKKLDGTCLRKDTGEYTYEVCLFDEARQIPNKGGSTFSLGKFSSWNPDTSVEVGTPEFYSKQAYRGGARCWNGPERSLNLIWTCGVENAIFIVSEPEKCEYQFTGTSPALCLPLENGSGREEL